MKIAVVGAGYVGLVTGTCFASLGNSVVCVDIDEKKIAALKKGKMPIYEPGLEELVCGNLKKKTLIFTTDLKAAVHKSDLIFIAVGTPPKANGEADLSFVENVARTIAQEMTTYKLIVEKSTVPVQTGAWIRDTVSRYGKKGVPFDVASNPEFLREGTAVKDFMNPDRVVLGVDSKRAQKLLAELYKPLKTTMVFTDLKSAEIIKHASNSFLAMKISFINAISRVCELAGADVEQVASGMGLDRRIGKNFLNAGLGFGGFCFPKDLAAFIRISEKLGYDFELLKAVEKINEDQKKYFVKKIEQALWNKDGSKVITRYTGEDNDSIKSYSARLLAKVDDQTEGSLQGSFLTDNIKTITKDPDQSKIFYLLQSSAGSTGVISEFDGTKKVQIFDSPLREWLVEWPTPTQIALLTKPSSGIPGFLFLLNTRTGGLTRAISGIRGLTAKVNSIGSLALYSETTSRGLLLKIYSLKNKSLQETSVVTLPEKCVWSKNDPETLYCAVPTYLPSANYPDDWYKGQISFSDEIWRIDSRTGSGELLEKLKDYAGKDIDGTDLFMSPKEDYLFFTNKNDFRLWSLRLQP